MKKVKLHLILTDDWELRGNGSGNPWVVQFEAMRKLREIYNKYGFKNTFTAEIFQQLNHIKWGEKFEHLKDIAEGWEEAVKEAYRDGHDIQPHIHPQWWEAEYVDGEWVFKNDWAMSRYSEEMQRKFVREAVAYLESVLREVDSDYKCVAYRTGSWALAPSKTFLKVLADEGIRFDCSVVEGYKDHHLGIDYTNLDEGFLPYYPEMEDVTKIAKEKGAILELPTVTFKPEYSFWERQYYSRWPGKPATAYPIPNSQFGGKPFHSSEVELDGMISNLVGLTPILFKKMMKEIWGKAKKSGWNIVPLVMQNHTKDMGTTVLFEKFCKYWAKCGDRLEVITAQQFVKNLDAGMYEHLTRNV